MKKGIHPKPNLHYACNLTGFMPGTGSHVYGPGVVWLGVGDRLTCR